MPFIERWDLLIEPWRKGFATQQRPEPATLNYVPYFKPNYYDFCLLHLDQQCIYDPDKGDRISKGRLFTEVKELVERLDPDLPIFIINHMTPYHDKYDTAYVVNWIKKAVGDYPMICNSYEAQRQWGFGEVITHGIDSEEWGFEPEHFEKTGEKLELPKEPRCVIVLSPAGMEKAYRRIFGRQVFRKVEDAGVEMVWVGVNKKFNSFNDYRDYLGRSLVFFSPTWQSPRPRSRLEAMHSKCCIVTTPYHDADSFIEEGYNGFLTSKEPIQDPRVMDNPDYSAQLIIDLVHNRVEEAIEVGKNAKLTATKLFNKKHFDQQWEALLKKHGVL